jgi:hypothetical protein
VAITCVAHDTRNASEHGFSNDHSLWLKAREFNQRKGCLSSTFAVWHLQYLHKQPKGCLSSTFLVWHLQYVQIVYCSINAAVCCRTYTRVHGRQRALALKKKNFKNCVELIDSCWSQYEPKKRVSDAPMLPATGRAQGQGILVTGWSQCLLGAQSPANRDRAGFTMACERPPVQMRAI